MNVKKNTEKERMKFEAAAELGLADKLSLRGWGGLTSKETGRIGALIAGKKRGRHKDGEGSP